MSEQHCAARKALEEILNVLGTGECGVNNCGGCAVETQEAIALAREALAAPCEHAAEVSDPLVVRCHSCHGTVIYKRLSDGEIEVYHGCADAKKLSAELEKLKTELGAQLEFDRTALAYAVTAINKTINTRFWLTEGRGSYEWNDDRYRDEFKAAIADINNALTPLLQISANWSGCPRTTADVVAARVDLKAENQKLRAELDTLKAERQEIARVLEPFAKAWNTTALVFNAMMPFRVLCSIAEGDAWKKIAELHASLAQEKPEVPR